MAQLEAHHVEDVSTHHTAMDVDQDKDPLDQPQELTRSLADLAIADSVQVTPSTSTESLMRPLADSSYYTLPEIPHGDSLFFETLASDEASLSTSPSDPPLDSLQDLKAQIERLRATAQQLEACSQMVQASITVVEEKRVKAERRRTWMNMRRSGVSGLINGVEGTVEWDTIRRQFEDDDEEEEEEDKE
ncbi:hypothetical protein BZG36_05567 [Bifiguratus adelaidae]|uniref:Uncharacterized protein n=1 Tax=Bifiguratus adelaidae TaxID=1938954 RepID=A0A261XSX0_9FUNG|nr:hypothetical protein BZG36_05567 [Bifiguratus adelaidae]